MQVKRATVKIVSYLCPFIASKKLFIAASSRGFISGLSARGSLQAEGRVVFDISDFYCLL